VAGWPRFFGSEPLVKTPALKLKPGGLNPVQVNFDVGISGQMSAKAVVKPQAAIFLQIVRKVDDAKAVVDKQQKR
jgi:hypothetical protein